VAQGAGPEFKPQYCQKQQKKTQPTKFSRCSPEQGGSQLAESLGTKHLYKRAKDSEGRIVDREVETTLPPLETTWYENLNYL
jgi:hypothetical protein